MIDSGISLLWLLGMNALFGMAAIYRFDMQVKVALQGKGVLTLAQVCRPGSGAGDTTETKRLSAGTHCEQNLGLPRPESVWGKWNHH